MKNLTEDDAKLLAQVGRHYPQLVELLTRVRADELEFTVSTNIEFFPVQKGRIGMLTELLQQLKAQ